jgi:tRNA modification GTPase
VNSVLNQDTIAAIATPSGKGGVGIIRISGAKAYNIAHRITQTSLNNRFAHFCSFYENSNSSEKSVIDQGIAIFFHAPHSFTGEDVVELQGHGGPIILDALLNECIKLGARIAKPGEFSERAFLNDKIDLAQAEAIADLIESSSLQAAKNAVRSLQGVFSQHIHELVNKTINLRIYVEAAIDFPDEEIDFLNDGNVKNKLQHIIDEVNIIIKNANQGRILQEGITVVIAGKPNAGKSSILNMLAGHDAAIVTDIAGTTRDILKENILIDGMPIHIIDTAGLRESPDIVEKEGIKRALKAIQEADAILLIVDSSTTTYINIDDVLIELNLDVKKKKHITIVRNKCDINNEIPSINNTNKNTEITISAKKELGIDILKNHLKHIAGYQQNSESGFTARRRHIDALEKAQQHLREAMLQLTSTGAGELVAEDLRYCQQALNEITGEFSNDDLLGKIFSSFCIGK